MVEVRESIKVAAYWPGEGYGGGTPCETMEQAVEEAKEYERRGYGAGNNRIHIVHTVQTITEFEISPENRAKLEAEDAERQARKRKYLRGSRTKQARPGDGK